jgi:hypothetical protein
MLQAGRSRVRVLIKWIFFLIDLILPVALWVSSAFNRIEYQESSWEGKWWPARKANNLTAVCEPIV